MKVTGVGYCLWRFGLPWGRIDLDSVFCQARTRNMRRGPSGRDEEQVVTPATLFGERTG